jgi:hypothetical protein
MQTARESGTTKVHGMANYNLYRSPKKKDRKYFNIPLSLASLHHHFRNINESRIFLKQCAEILEIT